MQKIDYINSIISELVAVYPTLEESPAITPPEWKAEINQFRHAKKNDALLVYLKGIRYISLLNASVVLLEKGFVHEIGILIRCLDESYEDAMLFAYPLGEDGTSSDRQKQVFDDFYQEEFITPSAGMLQNTKRVRVGRDKIRAAISNMPENPTNPHDFKHIMGTSYDTFSGYVHGAYPHIMELYGGNPAYYHTSGMPNTPRIEEWANQLIHYTYRGLLYADLAAKKLGNTAVHEHILEIRKGMEEQYPMLAADPAALLTKIKKKTSK